MKSKESLIDEIHTKMDYILSRSSISELEKVIKELDKNISRFKYVEKLVKRWNEDENV